MTAATGAEVPIGAPLLQAPITGLLAQAQVITGPEADAYLESLTENPQPSGAMNGYASTGQEWLRGVAWTPESNEQPDFDDLCSTRVLDRPDLQTRAAARSMKPFQLILRDRCSTRGFPVNDYIGRATRGLDVKRHWGVEREFESGALNPANDHLAATYGGEPDPTTVVLAGGAKVAAVNALALLDEAIANSAAIIGRGMIHATAFVVNLWKAHGLLTTEQLFGQDQTLGSKTQIYSPKGNLVVAGNGYEGRGPDGTVPGSHLAQWAYATDWIVVVAGTPQTIPPTFLQAIEQERDLVVYQQHQWFAILWSGLLHAAVQVATDTPASPNTDDDDPETVTVTAVDAKVLTETVVRQTGGTTRTITAGARSRTIAVIAVASTASPTYNGVALPVGSSFTVSVDHPGDTLPAASLVTVAGDDVLFIETR